MIRTSEKLVWLAFLVTIPTLSLWGLLFKPGLWAYADQHFPLTSSFSPLAIVFSSPLNGFSFDRIIITWPYYFISALTSNLAIRERVFIYYTFLLYAVLCYVFAHISVKFYSQKIAPISGFQKNLGKLAIFLFAYSNLSAINLNADGGTWADSLILIMISISIILMLSSPEKFYTYAMIAGMIMVSVLLDPDYLPMFILTSLIISLINSVSQRSSNAIKYSIFSLVFSALPAFYLYLQAYFSSNASALTAINALGYRSYSSGSISWASGNINFYSVFLLIGHVWSTVVFGPPSIMFYDVSHLPLLLNQVLVTPDLWYPVWIISLTSIPIVSFMSLTFKKSRKYAIPIALLWLIASLFVLQWKLMFIYNFLYKLTYIPIFGSAIGTTLSVPGHWMNWLAFIYLPFFSLGFLSLLFYIGSNSKKGRKNFHLKELSISILVVGLVLTGGWQAFNGSFYPMRYSPGSYLVGNAVEPKGAYSPTVVSPDVIGAYRLVTSGYSHSAIWFNPNYNTLWIGGPSVNEFTWSSPIGISTNGISYLYQNNMSYDVPQYLAAHGIRYVVVSGEDISKNVPNPFGVLDNYENAVSFFKSSGLKVVYSKGNVTVFEVPKTGVITYSQILLNPSEIGGMSATLYNLFSMLGYNVSFTDKGYSIGLDNTTTQFDLITPALLPFSGLINEGFTYLLNVSSDSFKGSLNYTQIHNLGQFEHYFPNGFDTSDWSGNISVSYSNGTINVYGNNSGLSIDYNGTLIGSPSGYHIYNTTVPVSVSLAFTVNGSIKEGTLNVLIVGEGNNPKVYTYWHQINFNISQQPTRYKIEEILPKGTAYVGFRIGFYGFTGKASIGQINFRVFQGFLPDPQSPFGQAFKVTDAVILLSKNYSEGFVIVGNSTSYSVLTLKPGMPLPVRGKILGVLLTKNDIKNYTGDYAVVNMYVPRAITVKENGIVLKPFAEGNDGAFIYELNKSGSITLSPQFSVFYALYLFYAVIILLIMLLLSANFLSKSFSYKGKR
ncbi:MAG: hypothetical protein ACP5NC_03800 [Nitrososphaeria archaeon]